jgi:hypothetical protein
MSTASNNVADDMRYLRELAEAGTSAPLQMGPYLIAGGAWFSGASFVLALAQMGLIPVVASMVNLVFVAAAIGFAIHLAVLIRADRAQVERGRNRFINAAWTSAAFGIFAFCVAVALLSLRLQDSAVLSTISLVVLCVYGLVWWLCASVTGFAWMRGIALLSFLSMLLVAWLANTAFAWLTYGLALVLTALLPGIYIVRTQKTAV